MGAAGCRFVNIGPVRDNLDTGTAVEWIPVRPNTDTAMLLGIAWVLRDTGLHDPAFLTRHCVGWEVFERYLTGAENGVQQTPDWASQLCCAPEHRKSV